MSHFSLAIFTAKKPDELMIDAILAPYDENTEVAPYVYMTKEQIIRHEREKLEQYKESWQYKEYYSNPKKYSREHPQPAHLEYLKTGYDKKCKSTDEELYQDYIKYYEADEIDENGGILSTTNPNAKWDWYDIGGRWNRMLQLNKGTSANQARVKDVNWGVQDVEEYRKTNPNVEREYQAHLKQLSWCLGPQPTLEEYMKEKMRLTTYAVLAPAADAEGTARYEWHEPGECLMFGITTATKEDSDKFHEEYYEKFVVPNMESWVTIVDCHI